MLKHLENVPRFQKSSLFRNVHRLKICVSISVGAPGSNANRCSPQRMHSLACGTTNAKTISMYLEASFIGSLVT